MGQTYECAVQVLVWLGTAEDDSDFAMDKYDQVGKKAIEAGIQDFRATTDIPKWFDSYPDERICALRSSLNGLAEREEPDLFRPSFIPFPKRSYWTRVWVLQEISIPRSVAVLCGAKTIEITTFMAAINFCALARWILNTRYTLDDRRDSILGPQLQSISSNPPGPAPNVLTGARRRYQSETGTRECLLSLLSRTSVGDLARSPLEATDARDEVYGLLALSSDPDDLGIFPDYTRSTIAVYTHTARALLSRRHLDILTWSQPCNKRIQSLPTWVPDFSSPIYEPCGEDRATGPLFSASKPRTLHSPSPTSPPNPPKLTLHGLKIDTITTLGTPWDTPTHFSFNATTAQTLMQEVSDFCHLSPLVTTPRSNPRCQHTRPLRRPAHPRPITHPRLQCQLKRFPTPTVRYPALAGRTSVRSGG